MAKVETKNPPYTAAHIANYILEKASMDSVEITNLKLQKLVYIFFGWSLVLGSKKVLFKDSIRAWKYGPVIPSLYHQFKKFEGRKIEEGTKAVIYDLKKNIIKDADEREINSEIRQTLDMLWRTYKNASSGHLVFLTHEKETPWWKTYDDLIEKEIPVRRIKSYYLRLKLGKI